MRECSRAASGSWASAIASTAPRTRARASSSAPPQELGSPASRSRRSSRRPRSRRCRSDPERVLATNVEYYSAVVLDVAEIPPPLAPAMFACSRVAGWSAHILEQKRTGRLFRPSATYVGPAAPHARVTLAEAVGRAAESPSAAGERRARELRAVRRRPRGGRPQPGLPRARARLPRDRPVPLRPEDRAAPPRPRGHEPGVPRVGATLARAALARPSRGS